MLVLGVLLHVFAGVPNRTGGDCAHYSLAVECHAHVDEPIRRSVLSRAFAQLVFLARRGHQLGRPIQLASHSTLHSTPHDSHVHS